MVNMPAAGSGWSRQYFQDSWSDTWNQSGTHVSGKKFGNALLYDWWVGVNMPGSPTGTTDVIMTWEDGTTTTYSVSGSGGTTWNNWSLHTFSQSEIDQLLSEIQVDYNYTATNTAANGTSYFRAVYLSP